MNLKNNEFLMLVVAFLLGYFAHRILKGCRLVEGNETDDEIYKCSAKFSVLDEINEFKEENDNDMTGTEKFLQVIPDWCKSLNQKNCESSDSALPCPGERSNDKGSHFCQKNPDRRKLLKSLGPLNPNEYCSWTNAKQRAIDEQLEVLKNAGCKMDAKINEDTASDYFNACMVDSKQNPTYCLRILADECGASIDYVNAMIKKIDPV